MYNNLCTSALVLVVSYYNHNTGNSTIFYAITLHTVSCKHFEKRSVPALRMIRDNLITALYDILWCMC